MLINNNKNTNIMTPRIEKAINIFLDALNEGTLAKGTCTACAVGNLVADGMNAKIFRTNSITGSIKFTCDKINSHWGKVFQTDSNTGRQMCQPEVLNFSVTAAANIRSTDFTIDELVRIEHAFELSTSIHHRYYHRHTSQEIRADQIKGLEAVVKVMLDFDKSEDNVKEVFTEKAEALCI